MKKKLRQNWRNGVTARSPDAIVRGEAGPNSGSAPAIRPTTAKLIDAFLRRPVAL
jgi:hypothetical protein